MKFLISFLLFSTYLTLISTENVIPSHTLTPFSLTKTRSSEYFEWKNNYASSDIFIIFSKATGYTSSIYIYQSKEKLNEDITNNSFTNSLWNSRINSKVCQISSSNTTIVEGVYYIYITEPNGFFYSDSFTIFNEHDTKQIHANTPYVIYKFGSKASFSLELDFDKSSIGRLYIVNEIQQKDLVNVTISLNDITNVVHSTTEPSIEFPFNENLDQEGKYIISFNNLDKSEQGNKINILLLQEYEDKMRLHHEITEDNYFVQNINQLYYYIDITDYAIDQFNMLTFEFTQRTLNDYIIKGIYTKILNTDNKKASYLKTLMPTEGSDFLIQQSNVTDRVSHMFFTRTIMHNETHPHTVILITIDLNNTLSYREPDFVKATLSARIQNENTFLYPNSKQFKFNLLDYVPKVIRVTIANLQADFSYVFYSSGQAIMTTYNGTVLTKSGFINSRKTKNQIFVISKGKNNTLSTFDIVLFGQKQSVTFELITTHSDIMYFSSYRPTKTISKEFTTCNEPFYIIGSYSSPYSSYMFLNSVFGEFKMYYKNYTSFINDLLAEKSLFPMEEKYAINDNTIAYPEGIMDIIAIKCELPGWFNLHMMYYSLPSVFKANSRTANFIAKSESKVIEFPSSGVETNWNIELNEVLNKEIKYTLGNETITLNSTYKKHFAKVNSKEYSSLKIEPSENDNIIHVAIVNDTLTYQVISDEGTYEKNTDSLILFNVKQDLSYQGVKVHIDSLGYHSFMFAKHIPTSELVVPLPGNSNIDTIKNAKEFTLVFANPYKLAVKGDINEQYYLLFQHMGNTASNPKTVSLEYIEYSDVKVYNKSSIITVDNFDSVIGLENSTNSTLYLVVDICNDNTINQKRMQLGFYNTTLNEYHLGSKYNIFSSRTYDIELSVQFANYVNNDSLTDNGNEYNGIHLSYFYADNYDTALVNEHIAKLNTNVKIDFDELQWDKIPNDNELYEVTYTIYVLSSNSSMKDYYDNSCYLKSLKQSNGDEVIDIGTSDTNSYKMKSNTTVYVNVIAHIKSDLLNLDVVYKSKEVTPKINPDKKDKCLIYLLIGIVGVIILVVIIVICIRKRKLKDPNINAVQEGNLLNEDNMFTKEEFDK